MTADEFIRRWKGSGGSERGNFQQFASELTDILGVDRPKPVHADGQNDDYRFERPVAFLHKPGQKRGSIDLYRRGCFVMEAKQGAEARKDEDQLALLLPELKVQRVGHGARGSRQWDDTMLRARGQADDYARAVAREDGWPPFLLIVDVGHVIEVYSDFSGQGQGYTQFPDGSRYRIRLEDLARDEVRARLRMIWQDPQSLDPSRTAAKVTREVAAHLAALGNSFEGSGHASETVARFLMRCLFTMFAEDVELLPRDAFSGLLHRLRGQPDLAAPAMQSLWQSMDTGGFAAGLTATVMRFNGGLFRDATALPLNEVQLSLLIEASEYDWSTVEPAIFGTLLERALDKKQRHKLGAHYTPRAYVERLVLPTVIEPLRADWRDVQAAAMAEASAGRLEAARAVVRAYHDRLCTVRVLDPACGSGNFLYVAMELMKRLEGEVTSFLTELGEDQAALALAGHTVDPHQFLGIELNPWAAAVAELVLWIGYLQWHFRTYGRASPSEPVLKDFRNIECRDAVLTWERRRPRLGEGGQPVTKWDGETMVVHPVTGERVPDPEARVQLWDYVTPRPALWPDAEFIVGNPPFIGDKKMRETLGDGYAEALRQAYLSVPDSANFVMYWWDKAAESTQRGTTRRFGLITTSTIRQAFNRRVLDRYLKDTRDPLSLVFAVPDHPWVDASDGAQVRIAITICASGLHAGRLASVVKEGVGVTENEGRVVTLSVEKGHIFSNLRIGADVGSAVQLKANSSVAYQGVIPGGVGFFVSKAEAEGQFSEESRSGLIKRYMNGKEFVEFLPPRYIIDLTGLSEPEVLARAPAVYQRVLDTVKPVRSGVKRKIRRDRWWLFSEANTTMRPMFSGLTRYIVTCRAARHRVFGFLDVDILPDTKLIAIGLDDGAFLSVLSSKIHGFWSIAAGGWLGVGNDPNYNHVQCFNPFPFPDLDVDHLTRLRSLGEQLDAHRKAQQTAHPKLTLTAMYNVLEKLRAKERIEGKDREVYDQGLIGILKDIHDQIDAEVAAAYGWRADLSEDEILQRLVDLNRERAAEEARGIVRWLRPEYQNPTGKAQTTKGVQIEADLGEGSKAPSKAPWPKELPAQIAAVRAELEELGEATPEEIARRFARVRKDIVTPLLAALTALGQARFHEGKFVR